MTTSERYVQVRAYQSSVFTAAKMWKPASVMTKANVVDTHNGILFSTRKNEILLPATTRIS